MSRTMRAAVAAIALALAIAPVAAAGTINESLSVNSVLTVTGLPASINYGALDPGSTSGDYGYTVNVTANSGYTMTMSGTDFTGAGTIGKAQRDAKFGLFGNSTPTNAPGTYTDFGTSLFDGSTILVTGAAGASNFNVDFRVRVPANAGPGSYSGSITYTFTAS